MKHTLSLTEVRNVSLGTRAKKNEHSLMTGYVIIALPSAAKRTAKSPLQRRV